MLGTGRYSCFLLQLYLGLLVLHIDVEGVPRPGLVGPVRLGPVEHDADAVELKTSALPSVADPDRVDEHRLVRCLRLLPSPSPLPGPVPRRRDGEVVDELLDVFADPVQRKDQDLDRPVALQHLAQLYS